MSEQMTMVLEQRVMSHDSAKDRSCDSPRPSNAHLRPGVGSSRCKCGGCQQAFNSLSAFDMHQRLHNGRSVCIYPLDTVDKKGNPKPMAMNAAGWWVTALREDGVTHFGDDS